MSLEDEKRLAAQAAASLVEDGMVIGLGTGSTVSHFIAALVAHRPAVRCVTTSPQTEREALKAGLRLEQFEALEQVDVAVDGADQVASDGWLVKGGGGAHTREKIVAAAAGRFVVIVSSNKPVARIGPPVPVEILPFGLAATIRALGDVTVRDGERSPDRGVIADYGGPVDDPAALSAHLDAVPGIVGHGLFPPSLVSLVLIGRGDRVEEMRPT